MTDERQKQPASDWSEGAPDFLEALKHLKNLSLGFQYQIVLDPHVSLPKSVENKEEQECKNNKKKNKKEQEAKSNKKKNKESKESDGRHSAPAPAPDAGSSEYFITYVRTNLPLGRGDFLPTLNGRAYALVRSHATKECKIARYDPVGEYFSGPVLSIAEATRFIEMIGDDIRKIYVPCRSDWNPTSPPKKHSVFGS